MAIFTFQNFTLLLAALINIVMCIIVLSRGVRNKINLYFGLLTFFNFLWAGSLLIGRVVSSSWWYNGGAILAYPAALGIAISLYYFSIYFPVKIKEIRNYFNYFIIVIFIVLSAVVYIKEFFVVSYDKNLAQTEYTLYFLKPVYIFYSIYFITLVLVSIYNFYKKINLLDNFIYRKQIKILLITIIIGLIFGIYFDLILCYFGNFKYIWFGPIFTAFMNGYVFYLLSSSKDKISHG